MATYHCNFSAATNGIGTIGSPWNNPTSAQAGIVPGDTVMTSGVFQGVWTFDRAKGGVSPGAKTKWLGTLASPFVVSGGDAITGWAQCAPSRLADVGVNYAQIWEKTITKSTLLNSDPFSANICENNLQLPLCVERALTEDKFFLTRPHYYHTASSVTLAVANITGFRLPAVTDLFTKTQIDRARAYFVTLPNLPATSAVTFDATTKVISLVTPAPYGNSAFKDNFALANLLPAMKRGEWGFIDNGTTVTLFLWPQNVLSLAGAIQFSARSNAMDLNGISNVEVAFFKARQCAGRLGAHGNLVSSGGSDVYLHNFESTDTLDFGGMFGAIYMSDVDNLEMGYFDVRRSQGTFGIYCQGSGANTGQANNTPETINLMSGGYIHHYTVAYASSAAHRLFTVGNHINAFGIFWECSKQSHGNKMNAYQSSYNHLWWGIDAEQTDGFFTMQESDSIVMMFCSSSASKAAFGEARGIFQQQFVHANLGRVYGYKGGAVINCSTTPNGLDGRLNSLNSLRWGSGNVPLDRVNVWNNVYHGHGAMTTADFGTVDDWDHNVTTIGTPRGPNDVFATLAATYVNAAINDFRYAPASIVRTKPAKDLTAYVAALKIRFPKMPDADWSKDMVGEVFTWANIGMGPTKNKDAARGAQRNITYSGLTGGSSGGGGGQPTKPVFAPGFKIKVAA